MLVFAHRGFRSAERSENTLEAFQAALDQGADGIEFDLRLSKEGELVVFHDANLHRVAGDAHRVAEMTAHELSEVVLRHGGRIPTLNEVTAHVHAPILFDMEVKTHHAVEPLIVKLKTSATLRERTIVSSFHASVLKRIHEELPDVRTLWLIGRWPLPLRSKALFRKALDLHPWGIASRLSQLNRRRIMALKRLGFQVGLWDMRGSMREARAAAKLPVDLAIVRHAAGTKRALLS